MVEESLTLESGVGNLPREKFVGLELVTGDVVVLDAAVGV